MNAENVVYKGYSWWKDNIDPFPDFPPEHTITVNGKVWYYYGESWEGLYPTDNNEYFTAKEMAEDWADECGIGDGRCLVVNNKIVYQAFRRKRRGKYV